MITNPADIQGAWSRGWTLDVHTIASVFLGYDEHGHAQYDTTRSPLGELIYQLKYRGQQTAAQVAADSLKRFMLLKHAARMPRKAPIVSFLLRGRSQPKARASSSVIGCGQRR